MIMRTYGTVLGPLDLPLMSRADFVAYRSGLSRSDPEIGRWPDYESYVAEWQRYTRPTISGPGERPPSPSKSSSGLLILGVGVAAALLFALTR